jgi:CsoR family transcriptional regulator, copper-sensing transcriptional repressor
MYEMNLQNEETRTKLVQRLRRIEGQVRGIERLLEESRDCKEIVQQAAAVQAAMQGFSRTLLEEYAVECFLERAEELGSRPARESALRELVGMMNKIG